MKVLLVDDTELFLDLEQSYLARQSFTFQTARSGSEALRAVKRDPPDLVLLDLVMPEMDGDAVCRELKGDPATRNIPIVMLSSATMTGAKERCLSAGCDAFVPKPILRDELLSTIDRLLVIAQRSHTRVPTNLPCLLRISGKDIDSRILTISQGGLFLEMEAPLPAGKVLEVTFALPQVVMPVSATAVVRWAGRVRKGGAMGIGVQFTRIRLEDRDQIQAHVETKLRSVGSLKGFA